jgi:hypothetical protein
MVIAKLTIGILFLSAGLILVPDHSSRADKPARFNHQHPKHQPVDCAQCHVISPEQIEVSELPGHATCVSCHNLAAETMAAGNAFCGVCHLEPVMTKARPALFEFPRSALKSEFGDDFSHPAHLKKQPHSVECGKGRESDVNAQCARCHQLAGEQSPGKPEMKTSTGHATCFQCHCETPVKPPGMFDCRACHRLGWPKAPSISGKVPEFKHSDHEFDTRPRRKLDGPRPKSPESLCVECHQSVINAVKLSGIKLPEERHCSTCHTGRPGLPALLSGGVLEKLKK